jgi:hypothetical protein
MLAMFLRRFVLVLTGLAFIGGATVQAMPPSDAMRIAVVQPAMSPDGDCGSMKMDAQPAPSKTTPCKTVELDCVKSMGCIGSPTIPGRSDGLAAPVQYARVAYWSTLSSRAGLSIEPDLFPPITA